MGGRIRPKLEVPLTILAAPLVPNICFRDELSCVVERSNDHCDTVVLITGQSIAALDPAAHGFTRAASMASASA